MKTQVILLLAILLSGCLRQESTSSTPTQTKDVDWAKIEVKQTSTTTTTIETASTTTIPAFVNSIITNGTNIKTSSPCPPTQKMVEIECGCAKNTTTPCMSFCYKCIDKIETTTTTFTTTTTTLKHRVINSMPARLNMSANWTSCTKNRDCIIVTDCCGWDYGFKYAINEWSGLAFVNYRTNFCMMKDHRSGCGWSTPKITQTRCENNTCVVSYGGFIPDELQDNNFTYTYNWMSRIDNINYTVVDGGSYEPSEEYDPYGEYTPGNSSMKGNMQ